MNKPILLIDFNNVFFSSYFAFSKTLKENPKLLYHIFLSSIVKYVKDFNPSLCIVAIDEHDNWRRQYYKENCVKFPEYEKYSSEYKGTRKYSEMVIDKSLFFEMKDNVVLFLSNLDKFHTIQFGEADDIIATYSREIIPDRPHIIISTDRDFFQLYSENSKQYSPIKNIFINTIADKDFELKVKILTGDKGDSILPVKKGLGPKRAMNMIRSGELDALLKVDHDFRDRYTFNETLISFDKIPQYVRNEIKVRSKQNIEKDLDKSYKFLIENQLKEIYSNIRFLIS